MFKFFFMALVVLFISYHLEVLKFQVNKFVENPAPYPTCIHYSSVNENDVVCLGNATKFFQNIGFKVIKQKRMTPMFEINDHEFSVRTLSLLSFEVAYDIAIALSDNFQDFTDIMYDMLLLPEQFSSFYCHLADDVPDSPVTHDLELRYRACKIMRYWQSQNYRIRFIPFVNDFIYIVDVVDTDHLMDQTLNIQENLKNNCSYCRTRTASTFKNRLFGYASIPNGVINISEVEEKAKLFNRVGFGIMLYKSFYDYTAEGLFNRPGCVNSTFSWD